LVELETLGINRVLTSGQQTTALNGAPLIRKLTDQSKSIKVLAGAGINAQNARQLIDQTGVLEIHASASVRSTDEHINGDIVFGSQRRITCANKVRSIKDSISDLR